MRDTVTDGNDSTYVGQLDLALIMRDLLLDNAADLFGAQFHKNHLLSCVPVNRAASSSRRVRRLVSNCSLLTFTTMPPMMLGSTEHFSSTFLPRNLFHLAAQLVGQRRTHRHRRDRQHLYDAVFKIILLLICLTHLVDKTDAALIRYEHQEIEQKRLDTSLEHGFEDLLLVLRRDRGVVSILRKSGSLSNAAHTSVS